MVSSIGLMVVFLYPVGFTYRKKKNLMETKGKLKKWMIDF